jgi:hypothetical protein
MKVTEELKEMVVQRLLADMQERGYDSNTAYAKYIKNLLDIPFDKTAWSLVKNPERRNALRDTTWIKIAKHFNLLASGSWKVADTHGYRTTTTYMKMCKKHGLWKVLCDHTGFGKTFAAEQFADRNKDSVIYVDCSKRTTKSEFINAFAQQLGIERTGSYSKLWRDITDELLLMEQPLILLDEFGDVSDTVITLMKSLYNAADCGEYIGIGVFHIGADNLQKKLNDGRSHHKQSYAEYWSRFGDDLLTLNFHNPKDKMQADRLLEADAEAILKENLPLSLQEYKDEIKDKAVGKRNLRIIREQIRIKSEL